jgi:hypothetical protein
MRQARGVGWIFKRFPNEYLHQQLSLKQLGVTGHSQLWATV